MADDARPRDEGPRVSAEAVNNVVQTLAILAAGAWGVYTFVYEARIAPGLAPPSVSVTSALERVGRKDGLVAIRSTVTRRNVGQAEVRVLGLTYNVTGVRVRFGGPGALPSALPAGEPVAQARDYAEEGEEVLLRHGVLFDGATGDPSGLNPGEAVSRDLVFYADPARYDSIRFRVALTYAKMSDPAVPLVLALRDERIAALPGPGCAAPAARCGALATTDFGTEFSLWSP
ncbi:hypothetical protein EAH89_09015 [Roseomonas nepalensis]|uniref:Uncharacterized protein n=1 Tax=Muricoccus nepalensis TaxID=1854500 RepID=A0A502GAP2_9PROT|nr:hypothetical protein [Roseomonas nepalensis]TPG58096.1 hypothetical protein EAH89_09015 [Roseomonas nepalensis]